MNKIKVGDTFIIHCYKHNGLLYKTWDEAYVLEANKDYIVLGNCQARVTKIDGKSWKTREPAIMFFYYNRWYNVIAQLKSKGLFYYCNIASPFIIDGNIIKYIDYDLDLRVYPEGNYKVLDRKEYEYHKVLMKYSNEMEFIIENSLEELMKLNNFKKGPFDKKVVNHYYDIYKYFM